MIAYRPDIDGLRALAVLAVIIFHANLGFLTGGYVGVDVFFVISGFLITSIIAKDMRAGTFSLARFYERRIRRIFPALAAVTILTIPAALFLLLPDDYTSFSRSLIALMHFGSNFQFLDEAGYFDNAAVMKPLLHTWSLSVEQQFYLVFPLLALPLFNLRRDWFAGLCLLAGAWSFAACVVMLETDAGQAFYNSLYRFWELLIGASLALLRFPQWGARASTGLGGAGLLFILVPAFAFEAGTDFPGLNALFPCLGAALVILAGQHNEAGPVTRALRAKPAVFIGRLSYSLYLWHWPLFALTRYYLDGGDPSLAVKFVLIALTFGLSYLSWRFIEEPCRKPRNPVSRNQVFAIFIAISLVFAAIGFLGRLHKGWPDRFPDSTREIIEETRPDPSLMDCFNNTGQKDGVRLAPNETCLFGVKGTAPSMALMGDSHALSLVRSLTDEVTRHGASFRFFGSTGCGPFILPSSTDTACREWIEQATHYVAQTRSIDTVILLGRYSMIHSDTSDFGPAEAAHTIGRTPSHKPHDVTRQEYDAAVRNVVQPLLDAGKRVVIVYAIPETGYDIPLALARRIARGDDPASFLRPYAYYEQRHVFVNGVLDDLKGNIVRIHPDDILCADRVNCIVYRDGHSLYDDDDHLSAYGSRLLMPLFAPLFQDNKGGV